MFLLNLFALLLVAAGPYLSHHGMISPVVALLVSTLGLLSFILLFFISFVSLFSKRRDYVSWVSLLCGLASMGLLGGLVYLSFLNPVYDLTTDTHNPPLFLHPVYKVSAAAGDQYRDSSLAMNRDFPASAAPLIASAYPDLAGQKAQLAPNDLYPQLVKMVYTKFPSWKIVYEDSAAFHFEAEAELPGIPVISDIAIEVRPVPGHDFDSLVELRARDRFQMPDMGLERFYLRELQDAIAVLLPPLESQEAKARQGWEMTNAKAQKAPPTAPAAAEPPPPAARTAPSPKEKKK